ncbi:hypothetical protein ACHAXS_005205 [Conticribra weissflogii]
MQNHSTMVAPNNEFDIEKAIEQDQDNTKSQQIRGESKHETSNNFQSLKTMSIINLLAVIGTAVAFGIIMHKNIQATQNAIDELKNIHIVQMDNSSGLDAILTDANGKAIVTVAEGHTVSAVTIKDETSGGTASCISMDDLAEMVVNSEKGIRNIVSFKDEEGHASAVFFMDGDTLVSDEYVTLASGKYRFEFDSPKCQSKDHDSNGVADADVDVDAGMDIGKRHLAGRSLLSSKVDVIKSGESRRRMGASSPCRFGINCPTGPNKDVLITTCFRNEYGKRFCPEK